MNQELKTESFLDLPVLIFKIDENLKCRSFDPKSEKISGTNRFLLFWEGDEEKPKRWVLLFGDVPQHLYLYCVRYKSQYCGEGWSEIPKKAELDMAFHFCFGGGGITSKGICGGSGDFGKVTDPAAIELINKIFNFKG